jgi:hypothetical protein
MVRRALSWTAILLCAGLALGSCQLVGFALASTFPAAATQMTAWRSLSSLISASEASSFSISDVTAGGREYVILSSGLPTGGVRLIIMDAGLDIILTLTAQDIAGLGGSLDSAPAKLDAMGRVLVGNVLFSANASGLVFPPAIFPVPQGAGFQSPVGGSCNFISFSAFGNSFSYTQYYDTWLFTGTWTFPVRALPAVNTNFSVHAVFSDPDPSRQIALFVLSDAGDSLDHYLVVPLADLNGGFLSFPLQDFYEVFTRPSGNPDLLGYSNGGLIRFVPGGSNPGAGAFVRSDLSGADQPNQLPYFNLPAMREAFSPSGGAYFNFDLDTRIVTRLTAWWN